jgi:polyhydroxybutyrate depolymerase
LTVVAALAAGSAGPLPTPEANAQVESRTITIGGVERSYDLQIPHNVPEGSRVPFLVALHGGGGSAEGMRLATGIDFLADALSAVAAYVDAQGGTWAEGCDCVEADRLGIPDVDLIAMLIDSLSVELPIDPERVFIIGFSQGGLFAQRLACQLSSRISAVGIVGATISRQLEASCRPERPVSMMMILGTQDTAFPQEGTEGGPRSWMGPEEAALVWADLDACQASATETERSVRYHRWTECRDGVTVTLVEVEGGTHNWRPRPDYVPLDDLFRFFRKAKRDPLGLPEEPGGPVATSSTEGY